MTVFHPKIRHFKKTILYNNYTWYEEVDSSLKINAEYADMSVERMQPLKDPFEAIFPLYSNYRDTISNISEIDNKLAKTETDSNFALNILESRDILEEMALVQKERSKELLKELMHKTNENKKQNGNKQLSSDEQQEIFSQIEAAFEDDADTNKIIQETDNEVNKLIHEISQHQLDNKRGVVYEAEIQAEETLDFVKEKFDRINKVYTSSETATKMLKKAVETQQNFNMDLDHGSDIMRDLMKNSDELESMDTDLASELLLDLESIERLIAGFDLEKTMQDCSDLVTDVEKELDFATQTAKLFRYSMEFKGSDERGQADFVQPHIPLSVGDLRDRTKVSFSARLQKQNSVQGSVLPKDGLIFYLGGQDGNSDYMAVESVAGKVVFHFRISDGYGRIKTNETIFDSEEWRQIHVSR